MGKRRDEDIYDDDLGETRKLARRHFEEITAGGRAFHTTRDEAVDFLRGRSFAPLDCAKGGGLVVFRPATTASYGSPVRFCWSIPVLS